jgi:hypothetical protein
MKNTMYITENLIKALNKLKGRIKKGEALYIETRHYSKRNPPKYRELCEEQIIQNALDGEAPFISKVFVFMPKHTAHAYQNNLKVRKAIKK